MIKTILHLCADIGSDTYFYQQDPQYNVILIGKEIGVGTFDPDFPVHGIIANPVCTEFSTAQGYHIKKTPELAMLLHCQRIIKKTKPKWWVIENPFFGTMKDYLGQPDFIYQPWEFGSPWTKKTALWGVFNKPERLYQKWGDVPQNKSLYIKKGRQKPSLADLHKSAIHNITEFTPFISRVKTDSDLRSLCSQGFAKAFYEINK